MPFKDPDKAREYARIAQHARYLSDPERARAKSREHYTKHRERLLAKYSPAQAREFRLKREYGITTAQWDLIFLTQNSRCAVCLTTDPGSSKGWHTDHDHVSGRVRGILCRACNTTLGLLGDSQENATRVVNAFLDYLKKAP